MDSEKPKSSDEGHLSQPSSTGDDKPNRAPPPKQEPKKDVKPAKPNMFKRAWTAAGLDPLTLILMAKGALPSAIALAAFRATGFAAIYTTLGYLVAIMATLSLALQPRAKFLQAMFLSCVMVCTGAAVALLQIQCCVSARHMYSAPTVQGSSGTKQAVPFSVAASVSAGVWLFFTVYIANCMRVLRPQMMLSIIQYTIFTIVASVYAPTFPTMHYGMAFVRKLLVTFLTGFGIGTGVCLFVVPITSRMIAVKQFTGLLGLSKAALMAHGSFMHAITEANVATNKGEVPDVTDISAKGKALKENLTKIGGLFSKAKLEVGFAKKELGWGKLTPCDYSDIFQHISELILPVIGMTTLLDIMGSVRDRKARRNKMVDTDETLNAIRTLETGEWIDVMAVSAGPFAKAKMTYIQGLTHIGYVLELTPKPKAKKGDVEKDATAQAQPGDSNFAQHYEDELTSYHHHRNTTIRTWCEKKGIDLPASFWESPEAKYSWKDAQSMAESVRQTQNQQSLYLILYMEYLMMSIGRAILKMIKYADSKAADGSMKKNRLINPGLKRLIKLFLGIFQAKDAENIMSDGNDTSNAIWVGDSLNTRKDPEHLPPANAWEKGTDKLRGVSKFLASDASAFGFRAAAATISIGILAYLRQTHTFFLHERLSWALIMTGISMDAHTGRGIFGFAGRIAGTVVAMIASIAIYYIGDKKPAAVIPVFFLYMMAGFWFLVKHPAHAIIGMISMVTAVLIVGYELQGEKLGVKLVESNGQEYYAVYILGPYRLGTVCAGLAVAFFWTYFPYPVTTHATLRKDLGHTLYLLANYYSCVHTTVNTRMKHGSCFDESKKSSPAFKLAKARAKCFAKLIVLLSKLREHSNFTKWEPTFGGRFPREKYDELIDSLQHMFNYMSLMAYSSMAFTAEEGDESEWLRDFRSFTGDLQLTSHEMTSILCLVSASVTNAQPLPPYLSIPRPFALAERMEAVDPNILSVKHIEEPCYASFAVLEVASSLIVEEVGATVRKVQELVGEVDFSFHVVSTRDGNESMSTLVGDGGVEGNGKGKNE